MAIQDQYGLGFSSLDIKYGREYGAKEENVANKEVGLHGNIVDDDKNILSATYATRNKYQMETFANRLVADNTIGKMYKLTVDDLLVRTIQDNATNLLEGSDIFVNNGTNRIKGVRFNFDLDWIAKNRAALKYNADISAQIIMNIAIGAFSKRQVISDTITNINSTAYALDYSGLDDATGDVILTLNSITIVPPDDFDYDDNVLALYDILLAIIPEPQSGL